MFEKLKEKFSKKPKCEHVWCEVWEDDYKHHVLGEKVLFHNLSGAQTIYVCNKCGETKEGIFVPMHEYFAWDAMHISHFPDS